MTWESKLARERKRAEAVDCSKITFPFTGEPRRSNRHPLRLHVLPMCLMLRLRLTSVP